MLSFIPFSIPGFNDNTTGYTSDLIQLLMAKLALGFGLISFVNQSYHFCGVYQIGEV